MYLKKRNVTEDTVEAEVQRFKEERRRNVKQEVTEVQEVISRVRASRPPGESSRDGEVVDDEDDDVKRGDDDADSGSDMMSSASPARGRGRGSRRPSRGRGESSRRGGRGRGGRGRANSVTAEDLPPSTSRGSQNTRSIKDAFLMASSSKRAKAHAVYVYNFTSNVYSFQCTADICVVSPLLCFIIYNVKVICSTADVSIKYFHKHVLLLNSP